MSRVCLTGLVPAHIRVGNEVTKGRADAQLYYSSARNRAKADRRRWLAICERGGAQRALAALFDFLRRGPVELTMSKEMTGADMVIEALADQGVEHLFGYPGGAVLPIYDALFQQPKVQHILVRHEQGAVHAAEGYARSTGKVGCVLVTPGPGATNAVTGLTDALMDSIPLVCLTGQVPTHLIGNDAFQECDTVGLTSPCTKHNYLVKSVDDLARVLHEAFHIASSRRPGPVVVDIPKDIQFAKGFYQGPQNIEHKTYKPRIKGDPVKI